MSDQPERTERPQRPRAERTAPNRNPNELFGGFSLGGDASGGDPISRSVGLGYKIVEQYLESGRSLAAGVAPSAGERGGDTGNPMADLASRMMRHTADLFEVWFQMMDVSGAGRPRPAYGAPAPAAFHAPPTPADAGSAQSAGVAVQVESKRPALVSVNLRSTAPGATLVAHSLRSEDETLPRIAGVSVTTSSDGAPALVRVAIPDDQPDGIYNGMIIDEATSVPVGTVSVRLGGKGTSS